MITYEDFKKVEIRAGKILSAEKIPATDKLLKLSVDFAEMSETADPVTGKTVLKPAPRQIISGIAMYFPDPAVLVGKTCMFVTNLEPRIIKGYESNGMLFAISTPQSTPSPTPLPGAVSTETNPSGGFSLLEPNISIPPGTCAA